MSPPRHYNRPTSAGPHWGRTCPRLCCVRDPYPPLRISWYADTPQLTDAELVPLAVMQAMLGFTAEARWLRHARSCLRYLFPYLPKRPGCNKAAMQERRVAPAGSPGCRPPTPRCGATRCASSLHTGRLRAAPSRPLNAPTRPGRVQVLRLHLVCTLQGLPVAFALTSAEADERELCSWRPNPASLPHVPPRR